MKIRYTLVVFVILSSIYLNGQTSTVEKYYGSNYSLCHFIVKDTLWLGTTNCLLKILTTENKILQIYSIENSPITNTVSKIWVDKSNRVCVVFDFNNIALLENGIWQSWSLDDIIPGAKKVTSSFSDLIISENGDIFCYEYYYKKIYSYSANAWKMKIDLLATEAHFQKFLLHPNGEIWWMNCVCNTNTNNYVISMDSSAQIILSPIIADVCFFKDSSLYGIEWDGNIIKIKPNGTTLIKANIPNAATTNARIWVAANETVSLIAGNEFFIFKDGKISRYVNDKLDDFGSFVNFIIDEHEVAWIYTAKQIIAKFENGSFSFVKYGLGTRAGVQANSDKSILWFDSYEFICSYNVKTGEIRHFDLPTEVRPYEFAESVFPQQMWLATSRGLMHFDGTKWNIKYDTLKPKTIYHLKYYSPSSLLGMLIDGAENYLSEYDVIKGSWTKLDSKKSPLIQSRFHLDKLNRPWSNFFDSIAYFDNNKWNFLTRSNSNMPKQKWIQLAFDSKNKLYAASDTSLYMYDGVQWQWLASSSCSWTSTLFVDSRDWVWLGNDCLVQDYYDGKDWHSISKGIVNIPVSISGSLGEDVNGDMWSALNPVMRYSIKLTSTKKLSADNLSLNLYPNPVNSNLTVDTKQFTNFSLQLMDINGRTLESIYISGSKDEVELSLQKYSGGLYFVSILNKTGERFYGKVFKQ